MGLYIDGVEGGLILDWLNERGAMVAVAKEGYSEDIKHLKLTPDEILVCVVDNGDFLATGVAINYNERMRFNDALDTRYKVWFKMRRDIVKPVASRWCDYMPKDPTWFDKIKAWFKGA